MLNIIINVITDRKDIGNKLNTLACIVFGIIAGVWGLIGTLNLYFIIDPEIENFDVQLQILIFIWGVTVVFGFLAIFFYKKIHRHYEKITSPEQKAREKKNYLQERYHQLLLLEL